MNTLTGIILNVKNGDYTIIEKSPIKQFSLSLGKNDIPWRIGIDPATKYSGLAFVREDNRFIILLDLQRDMCLRDDEYYDDMYYLLKRMVTGKNVVRFITEKPFVNPRFRRTSDLLIALRGKIEVWARSIPELRESEFGKINTNSWKSLIINPAKGKNRFNQKGAIADDLCDLFPPLRMYLNSGIKGDLDSFDALGILLGYEKYTYTENGTKKISGVQEKSHKSFIGYDWVSESEVDGSWAATRLGAIGQLKRPVYLEYNERYSFAENITMATTSNDAVISIVPDNLLQQFQWKFGIDITEKGKVLIMFIFRKGQLSQAEYHVVQELFPMSEEMGGV